MFQKRQREKDNANRDTGSLFGALLGALLSLVLGVLLGALSLATLPVSEVREMPPEEEQKPHTIYFVQGQERGGNSYRNKEAALLQGNRGAITLNEQELNSWSRNTFKFGAPARPGEDDASGFIEIKPAAPRFRIRDDVFNVAMTMEVTAFGLNKRVLVQSDGSFVNDGLGWVFVPEVTYIGSAPMPEQLATPLVFDRMMAMFRESEAYTPLNEIWNGLDSVEVNGDELVLVRN